MTDARWVVIVGVVVMGAGFCGGFYAGRWSTAEESIVRLEAALRRPVVVSVSGGKQVPAEVIIQVVEHEKIKVPDVYVAAPTVVNEVRPAAVTVTSPDVNLSPKIDARILLFAEDVEHVAERMREMQGRGEYLPPPAGVVVGPAVEAKK